MLASAAYAGKDVFYSKRDHKILGIEIMPTIETKAAKPGEGGKIFKKFRGVTVLSVEKGSLAEKIGIQKGDFIYRICGVYILTLDQLIDGLVKIRPDRVSCIDLLRQGVKKHITFRSEDKYYKDKNFFFMVIHKENVFAEKRDLLGIVCNTKQTRNLRFFSVLIGLVNVKQLGELKKTTYCFFINLMEGEQKTVVI